MPLCCPAATHSAASAATNSSTAIPARPTRRLPFSAASRAALSLSAAFSCPAATAAAYSAAAAHLLRHQLRDGADGA